MFWYVQDGLVKKANIFCRAEVIKIEHPTRGDDTRAWGPPFAPYTEESGLKGPGEAAYYLAVCVLCSWDRRNVCMRVLTSVSR